MGPFAKRCSHKSISPSLRNYQWYNLGQNLALASMGDVAHTKNLCMANAEVLLIIVCVCVWRGGANLYICEKPIGFHRHPVLSLPKYHRDNVSMTISALKKYSRF